MQLLPSFQSGQGEPYLKDNSWSGQIKNRWIDVLVKFWFGYFDYKLYDCLFKSLNNILS